MDIYRHVLLMFIRTGIYWLHLCSENRSKVVYIWSFFWIVHKLLSLFVITNKSVPNWNFSESRSDCIWLTTLYETISKNNCGGMNKRIKHLMIHCQQLFKHDFHIFIMIISYFYFESLVKVCFISKSKSIHLKWSQLKMIITSKLVWLYF